MKDKNYKLVKMYLILGLLLGFSFASLINEMFATFTIGIISGMALSLWWFEK